MKIREKIVSDLSDHLLGPLNGINEEIEETSPYHSGKLKPSLVYITGILAPRQKDTEIVIGLDENGKDFNDLKESPENSESSN